MQKCRQTRQQTVTKKQDTRIVVWTSFASKADRQHRKHDEASFIINVMLIHFKAKPSPYSLCSAGGFALRMP